MTTITATLTIDIEGDAAADVIDDLGIDIEGGMLDQAMTNAIRQHLTNHGDTRDWRIVRATLTPVEAAHADEYRQLDAAELVAQGLS